MAGQVSRLDEEIAREWVSDADLQARLPSAWLGVDVGFIFPAVDSDGSIYRWRSAETRIQARQEHVQAGPVRIRKPDGSSVTYDPYTETELADIFAGARTEGYLRRVHDIASTIVAKARASDRGIVLEDWRDFDRARRAAWVDLWHVIKRTAASWGVTVRTVSSAGTSTTCPRCGHLAAENRRTRSTFRCTVCGYSGHADRVAAENIRRAADDPATHRDGTCSNPACDRLVWKAAQCCSCYFYRRRWGRYPSDLELEELRAGRTYAAFKRELIRQRPDQREDPGDGEAPPLHADRWRELGERVLDARITRL